MTPLTVVLPYCEKDSKLASNLIDWIVTLGENKRHSLFLARDSKCDKEQFETMKIAAMESFGFVAGLSIPVQGEYPFAANQMFGVTANYLQAHYKTPFLWMEPDSVPLKRGWLDDLAEGYHWSPKPFFGPIIHSEDPAFPKRHLNGVAIYPNNAWDMMEKTGAFKSEKAWDLVSAEQVIKGVHDTPLIFQFFGGHQTDAPPVFQRKRDKADAKNIVTPKIISGKAVLYHRNKDGSLIDILREDLLTETVTIPGEQPGYYEAMKLKKAEIVTPEIAAPKLLPTKVVKEQRMVAP